MCQRCWGEGIRDFRCLVINTFPLWCPLRHPDPVCSWAVSSHRVQVHPPQPYPRPSQAQCSSLSLFLSLPLLSVPLWSHRELSWALSGPSPLPCYSATPQFHKPGWDPGWAEILKSVPDPLPGHNMHFWEQAQDASCSWIHQPIWVSPLPPPPNPKLCQVGASGASELFWGIYPQITKIPSLLFSPLSFLSPQFGWTLSRWNQLGEGIEVMENWL